MASIQDIRSQYPSYSDLSDQELADKMHAKFYSDMPKADFYAKIGITPTSAPVPAQEPASSGMNLPTRDKVMAQLGSFGKGLWDIPNAGAQMLTHALPEGVVDFGNDIAEMLGMPRKTAADIDRDIAEQEKTYQAERTAQGRTGLDVNRLGGNLVATLPFAALGPAATTLGRAAVSGGISGGAAAALTPVTDTSQESFGQQKAEQMGAGAGIGALLGPVGYGVSKMVSPSVAPNVKTLMDRGVTPTPGQILGKTASKMEERIASVPVLGDFIAGARGRAVEDFNKAVYDDVLSSVGKKFSGDVGHNAIGQVEDTIRGGYNELLPKLTFAPDAQFYKELDNVSDMASLLPESEAKQFVNIFKSKVVHHLAPSGRMDGETFKGVESELSKLATGYFRDSSHDKRQLGAAIGELLDSLRGGLERSNPMFSGELAKINEAFAKLVRLQKAGGSLGGEGGVFTPAQFLNSVKSSDRSIRHRKFARGDAMMQDLAEAGKSVLGSKVPNSGTPERALTAALAAGYVEPLTLSASALGILPYTKIGQGLLAGILTKRPASSAQAASLLRKAIPALSQTTVRGLLGQ